MPSSFGRASIPKTLQSNCITYRSSNIVTLKIVYNGVGTFGWQIGTADDFDGTNLVWEDVTLTVDITNDVTLSTPNKALFYRIVGSNGAYITYIEIKIT